jgi:very-short-patch-repair endonuclease
MSASQKIRTTERGEALVAIMNDPRDFALLREQLWYRVPVASAPKRWPPALLALYQTKVFGDEAYAVHYYGRVKRISVVSRRDLLPEDWKSEHTDRKYYKVELEKLVKLDQPIVSRRWRRIVFIPTTAAKLFNATQINDLFDDSPLENTLWDRLKELRIDAERQWEEKVGKARYMLDFAVFCRAGKLNIETDGDLYHHNPEYAAKDNERNNALTSVNWRVLRFSKAQVEENRAEYCVTSIAENIRRLGGLDDQALVPRKFHATKGGVAQQLSLLDSSISEGDDE